MIYGSEGPNEWKPLQGNRLVGRNTAFAKRKILSNGTTFVPKKNQTVAE